MSTSTSFAAPKLTYGVKIVLIVLGVVFLAQIVAGVMFGGDDFGYYAKVVRPLAVQHERVFAGWVWQPFTYMWIHSLDGWSHILFNGITLYFFGTGVEKRVGTARFARAYVSAGVFAGLVVVAAGWARALLGWGEPLPVLGASGAISAMIAGFCYFHWDDWLSLIVTRFKGKHLLLIVVVIDIVQAFASAHSSLAAHLAGIAFGLAWFSGKANPRLLWMEVKLWQVRRRMRVHQGGRDDRTYWN